MFKHVGFVYGFEKSRLILIHNHFYSNESVNFPACGRYYYCHQITYRHDIYIFLIISSYILLINNYD